MCALRHRFHPPTRCREDRTALLRSLLLPFLIVWLAPSLAPAQDIPVIPASTIRSLPAEKADQGLRVRVRARVTFIDSGRTVFIQDETAGTFFRPTQSIENLHIGDEVEVTGITEDGLYIPGIDQATFRILQRHAGPPPAQAATYDDLASGRLHYQRVSLRGVVHNASATDESTSSIRLSLANRILDVHVDAAIAEAPELIDAEVLVTGLAAGGINDRRQLVQPYLRLTGWDDVTIHKPSPAPSQVPLLSVSKLMRFQPSPQNAPRHRVRVRGTVLAAFPDGSVFLRDHGSETGITSAIAVRLAESRTTQLTPGDVAEIAGFPRMSGFSAHLEDAALIAADGGPPPEPAQAAWKDIQGGTLDAELIRVEADLVDHYRSKDGRELRLELENHILLASVDGAPQFAATPGSRVAVNGILRVEAATERGFRSQPERFRLLLRSPLDLQVLKAPPWWTAQRLFTLVAILVALLTLGLIWIAMLGRQVSRQSLILESRIAREAALEERQRIAREFHDTLEQELAGLSLRLDAATSRPLEDKTQRLLETSRHLVTRIQTEARNLVTDLRNDADTPSDLREALVDLIQRHPANGPQFNLVDSGPIPSLPASMVHHLRMIVQEAITNVLKHAQADTVTIQLRHEGSELGMSITDDGVGLDPEQTRGAPGHFGCMGIRERCRKIGAEVVWTPRPAGGTQLAITFPLPA